MDPVSMWWALGVLLALMACGDSHDPLLTKDAPAAPDAAGSCDPIARTGCPVGEQCKWIYDGGGHIGCAAAGTVGIGDFCKVDPATHTDNCSAGFACNAYGMCRRICSLAATSGCTDLVGTFCTPEEPSFAVGSAAPSAGLCERLCDPLEDNDFDGPGGVDPPGTHCDPDEGCFGYPSYGTAPRTLWACAPARVPGTFVHRTECTVANGCGFSTGVIGVNSCSEGYEPLLRESSTVTTTICVAFCKPLNCYAGNCGVGGENRLGFAPHRCMNPDAAGTFDLQANGEQCEFLWRREIDPMTGTYLPSPSGDTTGFCFDHSKYQYDSNNDGVADTTLPACADLVQGFGSGSNPTDPLTFWGASDLGCVDSTHAGVMQAAGKPLRRSPLDDVRPLYRSQALSSARSEIQTSTRDRESP